MVGAAGRGPAEGSLTPGGAIILGHREAPRGVRDGVEVSERDRLREALIELCFERGFRAIEVDELLLLAGARREAFEDVFIDLEGLFYAVFAAELRRYRREAAPACDPFAPWRDRVRATLYALYRFLLTDQRLARFFVIECRAAGERTQVLAGRQLEALFDLIDEGRRELADPGLLSRATAEATGGGILSRIYAVVGQGGPLPDERQIVPQLLYCVVLPYLGAERAAEELLATPPLPRRALAVGGATRLGPPWSKERAGEVTPKVSSAPCRAAGTVSRAGRWSNPSASGCSPPSPNWSPSAATGRRRSRR